MSHRDALRLERYIKSLAAGIKAATLLAFADSTTKELYMPDALPDCWNCSGRIVAEHASGVGDTPVGCRISHEVRDFETARKFCPFVVLAIKASPVVVYDQ